MQRPIPRRPYRDGVEISIIGFGGIVVCREEQPVADRLVAEAIDRGINYFDVAPSYGDGEAEEKLGVALQGRRDGVFLACKTGRRDGEGAQAELERSLRRLKTDRLDLYQFHGLTKVEEVEKALAPGGAGEVFARAKERGLARFLGFSAHSIDAALAMIERAPFPLDSVLFPVNYTAWSRGGFGPRLMEKARERGLTPLALKAMARSPWKQGQRRDWDKAWYAPIEDPELQDLALRWTLDQGVAAAVPPGHKELYERALEIAAAYRPLTEAESRRLAELTEGDLPLFADEAQAAPAQA